MSAADKTQAELSESALAEAVIRQWTWKTPAMRRMTVAVCRLALARSGEAFSANDLPEFEHGGQGIAGAIFQRLLRDGVLTPVGTFEGGEFCPRVVRNAGGNRIGVYRLKCGGLARRAIAVHGDAETTELKQGELVGV